MIKIYGGWRAGEGREIILRRECKSGLMYHNREGEPYAISQCVLQMCYEVISTRFTWRWAQNTDFLPLHLEWSPGISIFNKHLGDTDVHNLESYQRFLKEGIMWSDLYFRNILLDKANSLEEGKSAAAKRASDLALH